MKEWERIIAKFPMQTTNSKQGSKISSMLTAISKEIFDATVIMRVIVEVGVV